MKKIEGLSQEERALVVNVMEQGNASIKEIRTIDKICKVFEGTDDVVELEDADHVFMVKKLQGFGGWMANGKARESILSLADKLGL